MTDHKFVYEFSEGDASMRNLLGGKGANLAEMTGLGMPVPQGFTITTEACTQYYVDGEVINDSIRAEILAYIGKLEEITGKKFGDPGNPLLVSVRSGSRASMPGIETRAPERTDTSSGAVDDPKPTPPTVFSICARPAAIWSCRLAGNFSPPS